MVEPSHKARSRRALSQSGGPIEVAGEPAARALLQGALDVPRDERLASAHVHGFHSWPARMHPLTAARLIQGFCPERGSVLDPFSGSGTVLVEARLLARRAFGIDCNPLGVELSLLKTHEMPESRRLELVAAAERVAAHAEERRRAKAGPSERYARVDRELFAPHVLLELDGLRSGIDELDDPVLARTLGLVLSAILSKLSRRGGDTAGVRIVEKRLAGGFAIRFFVAKTRELATRLAEFARLLPAGAPSAKVAQGDARELELVRPRSIDTVVTSPPYPGVYDYFEQHAARLRWLRLPERGFESTELGARRRLQRLSPAAALEKWEHEFRPCLFELARVLAADGTAILVVGDAVLGGRALRAEQHVVRLAESARLELGARASQVRPHFHGPSARVFDRNPRREHALLFRLAAKERARSR